MALASQMLEEVLIKLSAAEGANVTATVSPTHPPYTSDLSPSHRKHTWVVHHLPNDMLIMFSQVGPVTNNGKESVQQRFGGAEVFDPPTVHSGEKRQRLATHVNLSAGRKRQNWR